jgi:hypothetical protein
MRKIVLGAGLAVVLMLAGCSDASPSQTPQSASRSPSPSPAPITSGQILTIEDGLKWASSLTDTTSALELRTGAQKIDDLVPRDKIWFQTGNTIGQDIVELNLSTFNDSSHSAVNVAEMKRIAIEIQKAIDHGNRP